MRKTGGPEWREYRDESSVSGFHPDFGPVVLCHSDTANRTGLDNHCPPECLDNLRRLSHLLGQLCAELGIPARALRINSGYRSPMLNEKVGGVPGSQHCLGLAADVVCPEWGDAALLAQAVSRSALPFDQLIYEFGRWVHVSAAPADRTARREILTIYTADEGYLDGLVIR
ncbi:D-Ala-D-Ala carboxypeptidase family metallohydrolase [Limnobacter humi]|uniref:D-Ala-D-Ala carboxypeptidase family metallohydrolase n=1 Tax=Limnobacter humi TaxID=1778671 RepID=A0ABT1WJH9_9BURK|nr:D-Ala-D-Ala carboxypeptidase family metallohydrolase [Limnobacter humi]MCQ8897643.1 D-Ala-D-Ala carboxypeptidase family metallohydrolase [Limnobacter humi]